MSIAIAVRGNKQGVFVGVDSAIVSLDEMDSSITTANQSINPKIMRCGKYLVAGVGSPRLLNVLRYMSWPNIPAKAMTNTSNALEHVILKVIPAMTAHYTEHNISKEHIQGAGEIYHGQLICAFGDYFFDINAELAALAYEDPYMTIGGPSSAARGAIHVARQFIEDPVKQILCALEATAYHSIACAGPFTIWSTEGAE